MGVIGSRRVRVDRVNVVLGDDFLGEREESVPVRRVEAGRSMRAAAVMKLSRRLAPRFGMKQPFRMMHQHVVVGDDMPDGYVGDYANSMRVGLGDRFVQQVPAVELRMFRPELIGEHGPLARAAEADGVCVVLSHDRQQLLRIEGQIRPEGGVVVVYQKDSCASHPCVRALHHIRSPRGRETDFHWTRKAVLPNVALERSLVCTKRSAGEKSLLSFPC